MFSIGLPIETALRTGCGCSYAKTLKFHNFLMRKYFFDRSKNKSPDSDVVYLQKYINLGKRDARSHFRKCTKFVANLSHALFLVLFAVELHIYENRQKGPLVMS